MGMYSSVNAQGLRLKKHSCTSILYFNEEVNFQDINRFILSHSGKDDWVGTKIEVRYQRDEYYSICENTDATIDGYPNITIAGEMAMNLTCTKISTS